MRVLHSHHILPLYVMVDDALALSPKRKKGGRPATLRDSEIVTRAKTPLLSTQPYTDRDSYQLSQ